MENTEIKTTELEIFSSIKGFEEAQRMLKPLVESDLVPEIYKGKIGNALIALDISRRSNVGLLMVMQNLHIIKGRPSWSSTYVISAINASGRFEPLEFTIVKKGIKTVEYTEVEWENKQKKNVKKSVQIENMSCRAITKSKRTGNTIEGPEITMEMAVQEGWYSKDGSKWKTMPELMIQYRAAAFFGRLHAADILMGLQTQEEALDMHIGPDNAVDVTPKGDVAGDLNKEFLQPKDPAKEVEGEILKPDNTPAEEFNINSYNLDQQKGVREAVTAFCALLTKQPQEERAATFIAHGGPTLIDKMGIQGLGIMKARFTELGINLPE